jgi:hypothetical protein
VGELGRKLQHNEALGRDARVNLSSDHTIKLTLIDDGIMEDKIADIGIANVEDEVPSGVETIGYEDKMQLVTLKCWKRRARQNKHVGSWDVGVTDNTKRRRVECKKSPANPVEDEANGRNGAIIKKQRRFEEEEV